MSRVKLQLPTHFPFCTEIPIRISDINYGGHLGNDSVLSLVHEARVRFLQHLEYTEFDIEGRGIVLTDAIVVYSSEGLYGDVVLVEVGTSDFQLVQCDMVYRLTNKQTKKEIARVKTGIAFLDRQTRKIAPVPDNFRKKCVSGTAACSGSSSPS